MTDHVVPQIGDFPVAAGRFAQGKRAAKFMIMPMGALFGAIYLPLALMPPFDMFSLLLSAAFPAYMLGLGGGMHTYLKRQENKIARHLAEQASINPFKGFNYFGARVFSNAAPQTAYFELCRFMQDKSYELIAGRGYVGGVKLMSTIESKIFRAQDSGIFVDLLACGWGAKKQGEDLVTRLSVI